MAAAIAAVISAGGVGRGFCRGEVGVPATLPVLRGEGNGEEGFDEMRESSESEVEAAAVIVAVAAAVAVGAEDALMAAPPTPSDGADALTEDEEEDDGTLGSGLLCGTSGDPAAAV